METLTLFEHEAREFRWTPRDVALLKRLRRLTGIEVLRPTIQQGKPYLEATEQVGIVRLGKRSVQIFPKMYKTGVSGDERKRQRDATRNLLHLLAYAGKVAVREHAIVPLLERDADWFEILTCLFATHLTDEWQRGPYRTYFEVEEESPVLKGKWRIALQLCRPERRHVFSVTYDDFGADNKLNRVFRFVVERLWLLSRVSDNCRLLGTLRQWMEEVTLLPRATVVDAAPALLSRLNQRFEPLLNLARLFLDGGSLQLLSGDMSTFSFLFAMNQLFEAFITNFIRVHRAEVLPTALHNCELLPQTRNATRYLAHLEDHAAVFRLEPDLAFRCGPDFPLLLDAKYKRLDPLVRSVGVSQGDIYQMHAYVHRYQCPRVVLLYPQTAEQEPLSKIFHLLDGDHLVEARTVDLRVDLAKASERHTLVEELRQILAGGI